MSTPALTSPRLIVVSGLPRSGTSMLMAMLAAGGVPVFVDGLRPSDEDNCGGYFEFEPVKRLRLDQSWLSHAVGRAVKIVVPLVTALPEDVPSDIIFLLRDLSEILASQSAMLARLGRPVVPESVLRPVFERDLAIARQTLAARPQTRCLELVYPELVQDPTAGTARIGAFLLRPFDQAAAAAVVRPKLYRQRQTASMTLPI